ncbi:adenosine deaminase [Holotrichia oblita]|uniref:Adenosine deaminase n=1 Tax=Holotrichia oblita TaxID=644536 RepID=A0ACB9TKG4_HOLOL|nr:adenosine deaminase [Holotrichia oblita]
MDNRAVFLLSNYFDPTKTETITRKQKDGTTQEFTCPELVKKYNIHMGYVDKMDMLNTRLIESPKSGCIGFYFILLCHVIHCSLCYVSVNAFILFKKRTNSKGHLNLKQFSLSLALGLIGAEETARRKGRPSTGPLNHFKRTVLYEIRYNSCSHMPIHVEKPRICSFCNTKSEPHKSSK